MKKLYFVSKQIFITGTSLAKFFLTVLFLIFIVCKEKLDHFFFVIVKNIILLKTISVK